MTLFLAGFASAFVASAIFGGFVALLLRPGRDDDHDDAGALEGQLNLQVVRALENEFLNYPSGPARPPRS